MDFYEKILRYDTLRRQKKLIEEELGLLSKELQAYAEKHGNRDDKGSYFVDSGDFICGKTARTSIKLNKERALGYAQEKMLPCVKSVLELDEDAFEALVSDGTIDTDTLEQLSDRKTTYAVSVTKKENMPEIQEAEIQKPAKSKKVLLKKRG